MQTTSKPDALTARRVVVCGALDVANVLYCMFFDYKRVLRLWLACWKWRTKPYYPTKNSAYTLVTSNSPTFLKSLATFSHVPTGIRPGQWLETVSTTWLSWQVPRCWWQDAGWQVCRDKTGPSAHRVSVWLIKGRARRTTSIWGRSPSTTTDSTDSLRVLTVLSVKGVYNMKWYS